MDRHELESLDKPALIDLLVSVFSRIEALVAPFPGRPIPAGGRRSRDRSWRPARRGCAAAIVAKVDVEIGVEEIVGWCKARLAENPSGATRCMRNSKRF
jgi:hypothetical protein